MDSGPTISWLISGLVVSFLLSLFFSIIKVVFNSVDRNAAAMDLERLRYYASKIEDLQENWKMVSAVIATGKTLSNISFALLSFMATQLLMPSLRPLYQYLVPLGISFFVLSLFAHFVPRSFALRYYRDYASFSYILYKMISWFLLPFATLFHLTQQFLLNALKYDEKLSFLSSEDQARITESSAESEGLNEDEKEMIRSIFDMSETNVSEVMVPRIDMKGLDVESTLDEVLELVREEGHSRIPVYKETIDSIVGILYAKDILSWIANNKPDQWHLPTLLKKPHFVPVGKKINDLMREFKRKQLHLAIVVDEYGGTAGLITMEDILEEIVGDIQDEYDVEEKEIIKTSENVYIIDPHVDLEDLQEELNVNLDLEEVDYTTLSGLIYHEYGDVPQEDTTFDFNILRITVLKMDNQRIEKVKLEVLQNNATHESETF